MKNKKKKYLKVLEDNLAIPDDRFTANFRMYTSHDEMTWDITGLINMVRFEGKGIDIYYSGENRTAGNHSADQTHEGNTD